MANPEAASAIVGILNKVMRAAIGLGVTASVLQTSLYTGEVPRRAMDVLTTLMILTSR